MSFQMTRPATPRLVIGLLLVAWVLALCWEAYSDSYEYDLDFEPGCTYQEAPAVDPDALLIGRIAEGILRVKGDHFWVCGEHKTGALAEGAASSIAYFIVHYSRQFDLNPWGLAGTIANESGFDKCALGVNPREWAIRVGLLERKKATISYPLGEIEAVINSKRAKAVFKGSGFDLGYCQILSRFYLTEHGTPSDMLSMVKGLEICAREMSKRATDNNTDQPWLFWKGSRTEWYGKKIKHWARLLGARKGEI